jgi:hypothetical protein
VDVDIVGTREGTVAAPTGLAQLEPVPLQLKPPCHHQKERSTEQGEMHLRIGGCARRSEREHVPCAIDDDHRASGDGDEPEKQGGHGELERKRKNEKAHVLPKHRIHDPERLLVPPKQERLPVSCGGRSEKRADHQRCRADGQGRRSRPCKVRAPGRHGEIGAHEECDPDDDEHVELGLRRHDSPEDVKLPELLEPESIGQDPGGRHRSDQWETYDEQEGGRAHTRTQEQRPRRWARTGPVEAERVCFGRRRLERHAEPRLGCGAGRCSGELRHLDLRSLGCP